MVEEDPYIEKRNLLSEQIAYWEERVSKLEKQIREIQQQIEKKKILFNQQNPTNYAAMVQVSDNVKEKISKARMLEAKIIAIEAEIEQLQKQYNLPVENSILKDSEFVRFQIEQELNKNINEYNNVITTLKEEITDQIHFLQQLKQSYEGLKEIEEMIDKEIGTLEKQSNIINDQTSQQTYVENLQKRQVLLQKATANLMKKFSRFLDITHFPTGNDSDEVTPLTKKMRNEGKLTKVSTKEKHYISFKSLLQDLMNKCLNQPHDPYITITENHNPVHIDLLIRSGVAEYHPKNSKLIKVQDFHR